MTSANPWHPVCWGLPLRLWKHWMHPVAPELCLSKKKTSDDVIRCRNVGSCIYRAWLILGTEKRDISSSAASFLTILLSICLVSPTTFWKCNAKPLNSFLYSLCLMLELMLMFLGLHADYCMQTLHYCKSDILLFCIVQCCFKKPYTSYIFLIFILHSYKGDL